MTHNKVIPVMTPEIFLLNTSCHQSEIIISKLNPKINSNLTCLKLVNTRYIANNSSIYKLQKHKSLEFFYVISYIINNRTPTVF